MKFGMDIGRTINVDVIMIEGGHLVGRSLRITVGLIFASDYIPGAVATASGIHDVVKRRLQDRALLPASFIDQNIEDNRIFRRIERLPEAGLEAVARRVFEIAQETAPDVAVSEVCIHSNGNRIRIRPKHETSP